ncbi:MAG: PD40 domain-containing protein [Pirellulales bacterium]|nr:PD40 domain-containing protein [Pirellulales bacterium]
MGGLFLLSTNLNPAVAQSARLNNPLPEGGEVIGYWIAPDSSRVVYQADGNVLGTNELFSAPIDRAGGQLLLSNPLPAGGDIDGELHIAPDSSRAVFQADADTDNVIELFSVPIDRGGGQIKINDPLPAGGNVSNLIHISPDSTRVVYCSDGDTNGVYELYSRPIDGTGPEVKINDPLPMGGRVSNSFQITPDSTRVVYQADGDVDNRFELYSRPIDGSGTEVRISDWNLHGKAYDNFQITPDSNYVVYKTLSPDQVYGIYSAPLDGSHSPIQLNDPFIDVRSRALTFQIAPNSSRVVYTTDGDTAYVTELYSAPINTTNGQVKLNSPFQVNGDMQIFQISPDSSRVVFQADGDVDGLFEIYSRLIDGSGSAIKLNDPFSEGGGLLQPGSQVHWGITPDSSRVIFMADMEADGVYDLFSAPIDSSDGQEKLNAAFANNNEDIGGFAISSDGQWLVYKVNGSIWGGNDQLFAMALDGSGAPFLLDQIEDGNIADFQISPNSQHVIYIADPNSDRMWELFSVPLVAPIPEPSAMLLALPVLIFCAVNRIRFNRAQLLSPE